MISLWAKAERPAARHTHTTREVLLNMKKPLGSEMDAEDKQSNTHRAPTGKEKMSVRRLQTRKGRSRSSSLCYTTDTPLVAERLADRNRTRQETWVHDEAQIAFGNTTGRIAQITEEG